MNREQIIQLAREANIKQAIETPHLLMVHELERFAALVAAAKDAEHTEKLKYDIHSCGPTCNRYACVAIREAVKAENEACAKVCEDIYTGEEACGDWPTPEMCAAAIRARTDQ